MNEIEFHLPFLDETYRKYPKRPKTRNGMKKGLVINGKKQMTTNDVKQIAKSIAANIGMKNWGLKFPILEYRDEIQAWIVVVQNP